MISQAECGLSLTDYNNLKAAVTNPVWNVVAHRTNPDFALWLTSPNTADNDTATDWDVVQLSGYLFRAPTPSALERIDLAAGTITTLAGYSALANAYKVRLGVSGSTLYVFAQKSTDETIWTCNSADNGASFSAWTNTGNGGTTSAFSQITPSGGTALASSAASGFPASNAFDTDTASGWKPTAASPQYVQYTFAADVLIQYAYILADNLRAGGTITVIGLTAANVATTLLTYTVANDNYGNGKWSPFIDFSSNTNLYRSYRFQFAGYSTGLNVSLIQLYSNKTVKAVNDFVANGSSLIRATPTVLDGASVNLQNEGLNPHYPVVSIAFVPLSNGNLYVVEGEQPGNSTVVVDGTTTTQKTYVASGIYSYLGPGRRHSIDHVEPIDMVDHSDSFLFRKNVRTSVVNSKVYVTAYTSDGSTDYPVTGYKVYTYEQNQFWSAGTFLPLPSGYGTSGVRLFQTGEYVYAVQRGLVYRSPSTRFFGYSAAAYQTDISSYIDGMEMNHDQNYQIGLILHNADGTFNNHSILNKANTVSLVLQHGYNIGGVPVLIQTGIAEVDSYDWQYDLPTQMLRLTAQGYMVKVADRFRSEDAIVRNTMMVGMDDFAGGSSQYGGLGHVEILSGTWVTASNLLTATTVKNGTTLAFNTWLNNCANGVVEWTMTPSSAFPTAQFSQGAGIVFRAIDDKNYYYVLIVRNAGAYYCSVWRVINGVQTLLTFSSSFPGGATQTDSFRLIFSGNNIQIITQPASGTAAIIFSYQEPLAVSAVPPYKREFSLLPPQRGFVGYITRLTTASVASVSFSNVRCYNLDSIPESIESVSNRLFGLAQVKAEIDDFGFLSGSWADTNLASKSIVGSSITVTGSGSLFGKTIRTDFTPPSGSWRLDFESTGYPAFVMNLNGGGRLDIRPSGWSYAPGDVISNSSYSMYDTISNTNANKRYSVVFMEVPVGSSDAGSDNWYVLAFFAQNILTGFYAERKSANMLLTSQIGFGVYGAANSYTLNNVRMSALPDIVNAYTVDPSEAPLNALNRILDGRNIKLWTRWNGNIKLSRVDNTAVQSTISYIETKARSFEPRTIRTFVRLLGAYATAEFIDPSLVASYGTIFEEVNNPYLMSSAECYTFAKQYIRLTQQQAEQIVITTSYSPLLEPEDHISVNGEEWLINSISTSVNPTQMVSTISARKYVART
jgi:hypothetical protein